MEIFVSGTRRGVNEQETMRITQEAIEQVVELRIDRRRRFRFDKALSTAC